VADTRQQQVAQAAVKPFGKLVSRAGYFIR